MYVCIYIYIYINMYMYIYTYIYSLCIYDIYTYTIYIKGTHCDTFPLPFCKTRWFEDECVAERATQLMVKIIKC